MQTFLRFSRFHKRSRYRLFAREELYFIHVDHIARFVKLAAGTGLHLYSKNVTLYYLHNSLLVRRWNGFVEVTGLLKSVNIWRMICLMVPAEYVVFQDHVDHIFHRKL